MTPSRLILFAHGSREAAWRESFEKLARELTARLGQGRVALAFLDHARPTFADAAESALNDGVQKLVVLPLFLSSGGHVSRDVPKVLQDVGAKFPHLAIEVLPAIGEAPEFLELLVALAQKKL